MREPTAPARPPRLRRRLSVTDHDRGSTDQRYVYAVVSRRSGGVSVGINLNPNRACNWRCLYCQVPELTFGRGPAIDLGLLERELRGLLTEIVSGDFLARRAPGGQLRDVAFSGDGEPTTSPSFPRAVDVAIAVMRQLALPADVKLRLITNGTMFGKRATLEAAGAMAGAHGEVWFKLDVEPGLDANNPERCGPVNGVHVDGRAHQRRLVAAASRCPTWVQTCACTLDGAAPPEAALAAYLASLTAVAGAPGLAGVLLYTLARPSMQPEAPRLGALSRDWLEAFAARIHGETGLVVSVHGADG